MSPRSALFVRRATVLAASLSLHACTAAPPPSEHAIQAASFHIDAAAAVKALTTKPNSMWQDTAYMSAQVRAGLKARGAKNYHLETAGLTWANALGGACSSAPAYVRSFERNDAGPSPATGDYVYVVLDNGTVKKIDPVTQAVTSASLGQTFSKSAVGVSGDNRRLYLVSTTGTFFMLDASTLATLWSAKISNAGFTGQAPIIDYSNGGGFPLGSDEDVFCMASDGSLYDVNVVRSTTTGAYTQTVNAWTSSNGTDQSASLAAWSSKVNIPFGAAVTPASAPIVWAGKAYWGTTAGTFYTVTVNPGAPTATPTVKSWNLAQYTSAPTGGAGCSAPPALDYDGSMNVTAIFQACGDRLCWIDTASGHVYDSPPLVVDKVPGSSAQYYGKLSAFPYTTTTTSYTCYDWASVAALNNPTPTRWGSGGAVAGTYSTGISCATIKKEPTSGHMWVGQQTSPGLVQALNTSGGVVGNYTSSAPNVNEICFDALGNCYAQHTGSNKIAKFNSSGTLLTSYTDTAGAAAWPEADHLGNLWASGSGKVVKFNSAGAVQFTKTLSNSYAIAVDGLNNALVTQYPGSAVTKYDPLGNVTATYTVGSSPTYVAIEPDNNNIWVPNYGSNTISELNSLGGTVATYATPANPWCVAFDSNNDPWIGCLGSKSVVKMSHTSGAILASYAIPGSGQPFEVAFDGNDDCWVSASNGTYKLYDLGNLSDMFAADGFATTADGDDSLNLMKFRITKGSYAGKVPLDSKITVTSATTPTSGLVESYKLYRTSPYLSDLATLWVGWAGTINMNYNNRSPLYDAFTYATLSAAPSKDTSQTFDLGIRHPVDAVNSSDTAYSEYSYGFRNTGKALKASAHWYSNTTAPTTADKPTLTVTLENGTALPATSGIQCQPLVDTDYGRVYIESANCLFELPYDPSSPDDFSDATKVYYNLTKAGRTGGPTSASKYLYPRANVQQNYYGDIFVTDTDLVSGKVYANRFTRPFYASASDHLAASFDASPGTGSLGQSMVWDYDKGSVYFTTASNYLIRGTLF